MMSDQKTLQSEAERVAIEAAFSRLLAVSASVELALEQLGPGHFATSASLICARESIRSDLEALRARAKGLGCW